MAAQRTNAAPAQPQTQEPPPGFDGAAWLKAAMDKPVTFAPFQSDSTITMTARQVILYNCTPTKSGKVCTLDQAIRFLKYCEARKLNPWEGDAYLVGYDTQNGPQFNLITAHQAFLKRAEANPAFDGMTSGVIVRNPDGSLSEHEGDYVDEGLKLVGGWAKVYRKDRKYVTLRRLKLEAYKKNYGVWLSNDAGMIVKCAEADGLRSTFPNVLGGMYVNGEIVEGFSQADAATPQPSNKIAAFMAPKPAIVTHTQPAQNEELSPPDGEIPAAEPSPGELFEQSTPTDTSAVRG